MPQVQCFKAIIKNWIQLNFLNAFRQQIYYVNKKSKQNQNNYNPHFAIYTDRQMFCRSIEKLIRAIQNFKFLYYYYVVYTIQLYYQFTDSLKKEKIYKQQQQFVNQKYSDFYKGATKLLSDCICHQYISQDDKKLGSISKLNCNCNNFVHNLCLKNQILQKKDEFQSLERILQLLNTDANCNQCCINNIYSLSMIQQVLSAKEIKIHEFNYSEAQKQKKLTEQKYLELNQKNQVIEFECSICAEELDLNEDGYILQCGCQFCRDCLKQNIDNLLKSNKNLELENIFCPMEHCKKVLNFQDISFILKDDKIMIEKLEQKNIISMFQKMQRENPDSLEILIICPGKYKIQKESGQIIYIPQDQIEKQRQGKANIPLLENEQIVDCNLTFIQDRTKQKLFHKCVKCRYQFCLNNCDSIHQGSCSDYQKWKIESNKDYRKELESQGYRFCPNQNCCVLTFRVSGCNRITCTNCNISYCFVCYFSAQTPQEVYNHMALNGH
ncbi:hypothetical protein ABPG72_007259 [Tetrahymena utriculariae]